MINGDRVRHARELRGQTQTQLAERVGVNQSAIAHFESGRSQPSAEVANALGTATEFPIAFFERGNLPEFPLGSLLFRARAGATATQRRQAHRLGQTVYEIADGLMAEMAERRVNLPRLSNVSAREASDSARDSLGLHRDKPIRLLINAIERAGVWVLPIPVKLEKRDAFSAWIGRPRLQRAVIVITAGLPADRIRFSLAHELGHLILHAAPVGTPQDIESEADRFAAEFLMPEDALRSEIVRPPTLSSLAALRPRWGVSVQALIRRAYDLRIISERQYRYMFEQLTRLGWRRREPPNLDVPDEKPRLIRRLLEILYEGDEDACGRLSTDLALPRDLVEAIVYAHADSQGR